MDALERLGLFQYHGAKTRFHQNDGWQYAPIHMIFDIKHDPHRKARFVVGGYITASFELTPYSSTIKDISVRLMMLVAAKYGLGMIWGYWKCFLYGALC
eukprot:14342877-Ditylum_brightwellii.AAC.1